MIVFAVQCNLVVQSLFYDTVLEYLPTVRANSQSGKIAY